MNFVEEHKAGIITFLIAGILVIGMFSIRIKHYERLISESYYELEPKSEDNKEELQNFEEGNVASSNKAFNEDKEFKELMRNFKSVRVNDFERTEEELNELKEIEKAQTIVETNSTKSYLNSKDYALNTAETESYNKLQEELNKRLNTIKQVDEHSKSRSTLTYSLKGRNMTYYNIPRYLCEKGGKIVVTIHVDENGNVFDAYINGSSNSSNQCLTDNALKYAMDAQFDSSEKTDQLGTITFLFKAKN